MQAKNTPKNVVHIRLDYNNNAQVLRHQQHIEYLQFYAQKNFMVVLHEMYSLENH